jgi:hypothetical protein
MKLTKTEAKLLDKLKNTNYDRISYDGIRESSAATKLQEKGLAVKHMCDGTYFQRRWDGSYSRRYHPQGYITKT